MRHSLLALTRANCLGIGAMLARLREFDGADSGRPMLTGILTDEGRIDLKLANVLGQNNVAADVRNASPV